MIIKIRKPYAAIFTSKFFAAFVFIVVLYFLSRTTPQEEEGFPSFKINTQTITILKSFHQTFATTHHLPMLSPLSPQNPTNKMMEFTHPL
jgi:hypothetical protein